MKRNDVIFLLGSSVLLVFAWIVFNIIHQSVSSTISQTLSSDIAPIPATFDANTINQLKTRVVISPVYTITNASGSALPTTMPTPTFAPAPFASSSTQVATSGGKTQ